MRRTFLVGLALAGLLVPAENKAWSPAFNRMMALRGMSGNVSNPYDRDNNGVPDQQQLAPSTPLDRDGDAVNDNYDPHVAGRWGQVRDYVSSGAYRRSPDYLQHRLSSPDLGLGGPGLGGLGGSGLGGLGALSGLGIGSVGLGLGGLGGLLGGTGLGMGGLGSLGLGGLGLGGLGGSGLGALSGMGLGMGGLNQLNPLASLAGLSSPLGLGGINPLLGMGAFGGNLNMMPQLAMFGMGMGMNACQPNSNPCMNGLPFGMNGINMMQNPCMNTYPMAMAQPPYRAPCFQGGYPAQAPCAQQQSSPYYGSPQNAPKVTIVYSSGQDDPYSAGSEPYSPCSY